MGLAGGKERWLSGVFFQGLPLWISLVSRGFQCLWWAEKLKLFLSSSVFMGSFSSYESFIIPRLDGVIHNSRFLTPNIHYSFSFKPCYSLFIIQLPPPKISTSIVAKGENSLSRPAWQDSVGHKEALHLKENQWCRLTRIAERRFLTGLLRDYFFWGEGAAIHTQATIQPCRRPLRETESHVRLKHKLVQNIVPL